MESNCANISTIEAGGGNYCHCQYFLGCWYHMGDTSQKNLSFFICIVKLKFTWPSDFLGVLAHLSPQD